MTKFEGFLQRADMRYGLAFDKRGLAEQFIPFYNSGQRIRVKTCGMELTGTISVTTGWRPCFLLMRTVRSIGSPWTLDQDNVILAVKKGKRYIPCQQT